MQALYSALHLTVNVFYLIIKVILKVSIFCFKGVHRGGVKSVDVGNSGIDPGISQRKRERW
jgi:hypothetical protein